MKFDRERDAIEYTQEPEEYTFTPVILGDQRRGKAMPTFAEMKAMEHYGTGQPHSHNIIDIGGEQAIEQAEDQEIPDEDEHTSVRIDIALGNKRHRITLFADSDPQALSAEFAKEHGLDAKL